MHGTANFIQKTILPVQTVQTVLLPPAFSPYELIRSAEKAGGAEQFEQFELAK